MVYLEIENIILIYHLWPTNFMF